MKATPAISSMAARSFSPTSRSSTGEFDSSDRVAQGTAAEAQAMKRACSKFGLGRYLYDLPVSWVGYDESSRRLTETPSLPKWALSQRTSASPQPSPVTKSIGTQHASVLAQKLIEYGYGPGQHLSLASSALENQIKDLDTLTAEEGHCLPDHAKSNPRITAKAA